MSLARRKRSRPARASRGGYTLLHAITMILLVGIILSMLGFTLVSLRKMKATLNAQLQSEQTWRRLSGQFRQDCHAAIDAVWRDEAADAPSASPVAEEPPPPAAQSPARDAAAASEDSTKPSADAADSVLSGGRKLTFLRADGSRVQYITLKQRVLRHEQAGADPPRWESYLLPEGMQLQWSWRQPQEKLLMLQLLDALPADRSGQVAARSGRRVRALLSVVGLDGNQAPHQTPSDSGAAP